MTKQIPLRGKRGEGKFALVDDADYPELSKHKWFYVPSKNTGYAGRYKGRRGEQKLIYMHRQITSAPDGIGVDHENGDGLDNTRDNLRLANQTRNMQNARPRQNCTSRYKGVYWNSYHRKWSAHIHVDGKKVYLGRHSTEVEAALAYNAAAIKHFGDFARLNTI